MKLFSYKAIYPVGRKKKKNREKNCISPPRHFLVMAITAWKGLDIGGRYFRLLFPFSSPFIFSLSHTCSEENIQMREQLHMRELQVLYIRVTVERQRIRQAQQIPFSLLSSHIHIQYLINPTYLPLTYLPTYLTYHFK